MCPATIVNPYQSHHPLGSTTTTEVHNLQSCHSPITTAITQVLNVHDDHPVSSLQNNHQVPDLQSVHPRVLQRSSKSPVFSAFICQEPAPYSDHLHISGVLITVSSRFGTQLRHTDTSIHRHNATGLRDDLLLSLGSATRPQSIPGSPHSISPCFTHPRLQALPSARAARCRPWPVGVYNQELLSRLTLNRLPTASHQTPPSHEMVRPPFHRLG